MRSVAEAAAGGAGRAAGAELDEHGGQAGPGLYYKTNKQTEREREREWQLPAPATPRLKHLTYLLS